MADLVAHPGDRVRLEVLDFVGLAGAVEVKPFVIARRETGGGGIGFIRGDTFGPTNMSFDELAHPLPGFSFVAEDGVMQLVAEVRASSETTVRFDRIRLTFEINGGAARSQELPAGATVCVAVLPPTSCADGTP